MTPEDDWNVESHAWAALAEDEQRMLLEDEIAYCTWLDQIAFIAEQQDDANRNDLNG